MRVLLPLVCLMSLAVNAQERSQSRSMVMSQGGIVATSQTLASQAGAQVLARGGSAIDAAIAANATLGVVEPQSNGMGGDLFAIYWDAKTGKLTGINASGWAPKGLTIEYLNSKGIHDMPQDGIQSVTVPGAVEGWSKLHQRFGKLPWKEVFQPAIYYAEHGYPVTELISAGWAMEQAKIEKNENARKLLLPNGAPPKPGQLFRNPGMAAAFKLIAEQGESAFYRGAIAKAILATSERLGGTMTAADLSEFQAEWVEPISTEYHGWKVYELPPNGQGIAALEMLNIMSLFPLADYAPRGLQELHMEMEAQKLAYSDLHRYVADTRFSKVPTAGLGSMEYARERAKGIDPEKANCEVLPGKPPAIHGDTIYLTVVDKDGNIASLIQSLYLGFGSGVVVDELRLRAAEPRRAVRDGSEPPQRAGRPQAAVPHDYSGVHGKGRHPHGLRHHGRLEPGAGARAVRFQHRGPRHEHPDGAGAAAFHQDHMGRLRLPGGKANRARSHQGPGSEGPQDSGARRLQPADGRRPGRNPRFRHRRKLWRERPAQGRRGGAGTGGVFREVTPSAGS